MSSRHEEKDDDWKDHFEIWIRVKTDDTLKLKSRIQNIKNFTYRELEASKTDKE
jgi:hypothetical protein